MYKRAFEAVSKIKSRDFLIKNNSFAHFHIGKDSNLNGLSLSTLPAG